MGASREQFNEEQMRQFAQLKETFEEQFSEQAKVFTASMGPDLSAQAVTMVRGVLTQIYKKTINKWNEEQVSANLDDSFSHMLSQLKTVIFNSKLINGKSLNRSEFEIQVNQISSVTKKHIIAKFLQIDMDEVHSEVVDEYRSFAKKAIKAEEVKGSNTNQRKENRYHMMKENAIFLSHKTV